MFTSRVTMPSGVRMPSGLAVVVILAAFGFGERLATAAAPAAKSTNIAGTYKFVGGSAETKALSQAIEVVVKKMSWISRGIARGRLRKGNLPTNELSILINADKIDIIRPGRPPVSAPANGKAVKWKSSDGAFEVTHVMKDGRLIQTMIGKNSHSTNEFELAEDGVTLIIHTNIASPRLPGAVIFKMTYRRK